MRTKTKISIVGLGKLGTPLLCFLSEHFPVIGFDSNNSIINNLMSHTANFVEPSVEYFLKKNKDKITISKDLKYTIMNSDVTFIVVPTPSTIYGDFDSTYVIESCSQIGSHLKNKKEHLIVIVSTLSPMEMSKNILPALEKKSERKIGDGLFLCYSPSFIALGAVIENLKDPSFLLIGANDEKSAILLSNIYNQIYNSRKVIKIMTFINAELTKLSINVFLTTKISFANMLARLCEVLNGADSEVIASAMGLDRRINNSYLKGSIGYGGPCFPRDTRAFEAFSRSMNKKSLIVTATRQTNADQQEELEKVILKYLKIRKKVGFLGITYKTNTSYIDESHSFLVLKQLYLKGHNVSFYDPLAILKKEDYGILRHESKEKCILDSDLLVIATPHKEFMLIDPAMCKPEEGGQKKIIIDCWRILDKNRFLNTCKILYLGMEI